LSLKTGLSSETVYANFDEKAAMIIMAAFYLIF